MYRFFICDDDGDFAAQLGERLTDALHRRGEDADLRLFSEPAQVLDAMEQGEPCDLLFLDILFGEEKGIRFARKLRERGWGTDLVFVTASDEYAVDGYDVQPLHYLLKPVDDSRIDEALSRFFRRRTSQMLTLATPHGLLRMPVADALYFEIYNHTVTLHLTDGGNRSWRCSLGELENDLPPNCFVRTHRSYLVNLEHIAEIGRGDVRLDTGDRIPVSKTAYAGVRLALLNFDRSRHIID